MVAEQPVVFVFQQEIGRADIRRQHTFLNQFVRIVTHHGDYPFDFALIVKQHLRFDGFKLHRTAFMAFVLQDMEQLVQGFQLFLMRIVAAPFQPLPYLGIGQPRMGAHHGGIKTVFFDIARISNGHVANHAQAFDIGIQRTNAVRQTLRQHRNHAAREIHTGGALIGILVYRIIRPDIMADIGNRHHKAVIAADFFGKYGIVKIACRFAVYRQQRQIAQILPALRVRRAHFFRNLGGSAKAAVGKLVRQPVFADGDFDFHPAVGIIAQNLRQSGHGRLMIVRITFNLRRHHLAGLRLQFGNRIRFQQNRLHQPLILRLNNRHAALDVKTADHIGLRALDNVQHLPFAPPPSVHPCGTDGNDVAMHQIAHLTLIQYKIGLLGLLVQRHSKSETVFMRLHTAFHQLQLFRHAHRAATVDQHLPVARHGFQAAFEKFILIRTDRQLFRQHGDTQRHTFRFQNFNHPFAAGQREFITLLLAG